MMTTCVKQTDQLLVVSNFCFQHTGSLPAKHISGKPRLRHACRYIGICNASNTEWATSNCAGSALQQSPGSAKENLCGNDVEGQLGSFRKDDVAHRFEASLIFGTLGRLHPVPERNLAPRIPFLHHLPMHLVATHQVQGLHVQSQNCWVAVRSTTSTWP